MSWLTPSGGLVYHLRALRHRARLWAPFRDALAAWLERSLAGASGELVLIGPSAGHCLPLSVLRRFERLTALEPDPLARALLRSRLGRKLELHREDLLLQPQLTGTPGLAELLAQRPEACVLFCNVLGQLHFALSDEQHELFQRRFRERVVPQLRGRRWASFHDRWSLDWQAEEPLPSPRRFFRRPSDEELGRACFGAEGPPLEVMDHGTSELFPAELSYDYFCWQLTPRSLHLVEAVTGA